MYNYEYFKDQRGGIYSIEMEKRDYVTPKYEVKEIFSIRMFCLCCNSIINPNGKKTF